MSLHEVFLDATKNFAKERFQAGHRTLDGWEEVSRVFEDQVSAHEHPEPPSYEYPSWPKVLWITGNILGFILLLVGNDAPENSAESEGFYELIGVFFVGFNALMYLIKSAVSSSVSNLNKPWRNWKEIELKRNILAKRFYGEAKAILDQAWAIVDREQQEIRELKEAEEARSRPVALENCTFQQAEELAAQWMRHLGASDAAVTQATRDGGFDVESSHFVVEVKHRSTAMGPSFVREIFGVAQAKRKRAVFFSRGGYTKEAIRFGRDTGVLLFVYDAERGTLTGLTPESRRAIADGLTGETTSAI